MILKSIAVGSTAAIVGLLALASATPASAGVSLVLAAYSAGEYLYAVKVLGDGFSLADGEDIELTGLSGVTNATVDGTMAGRFSVSFTSTSATFTDLAEVDFGNGRTGDFKVFSNATPGEVSYTMASGDVYGSVQGPAVAAPEPATWALMALGFAGLGFAGRRAARKAVSVA